MKKQSLFILGAGEMVQAMLLGANLDSVSELFLWTPTQKRAQSLALRIGGKVFSESMQTEGVLLGFKPKNLDEKDWSYLSQNHSFLISILAAKSTSVLQERTKIKPIIRLMPNLAVGLGFGLTLAYASPEASYLKPWIEAFLCKTGSLVWLEHEEDLDFLTPLTGCGPGLLFQWAGIWEKILKDQKFEASQIRFMVAQVLRGAAAQIENESQTSPFDLAQKVASRGGVTEGMLEVLQNQEGLLYTAYRVALERMRLSSKRNG